MTHSASTMRIVVAAIAASVVAGCVGTVHDFRSSSPSQARILPGAYQPLAECAAEEFTALMEGRITVDRRPGDRASITIFSDAWPVIDFTFAQDRDQVRVESRFRFAALEARQSERLWRAVDSCAVRQASR